VKYSPLGSTINLILSVGEGSSNQAAFVQLVIEDEGPGIPEDKASRVFDRFFRVDEGRTRDAGGAGLGLAIAKWAVEVHGGTIILSPRRPRGSIFAVKMPAA
jgi:signal transduction histidine kinase